MAGVGKEHTQAEGNILEQSFCLGLMISGHAVFDMSIPDGRSVR